MNHIFRDSCFEIPEHDSCVHCLYNTRFVILHYTFLTQATKLSPHIDSNNSLRKM